MTLLVRDDEESDWRPLHEVGPDDALSPHPARVRRLRPAAAHDHLGRRQRGAARLARLRDRRGHRRGGGPDLRRGGSPAAPRHPRAPARLLREGAARLPRVGLRPRRRRRHAPRARARRSGLRRARPRRPHLARRRTRTTTARSATTPTTAPAGRPRSSSSTSPPSRSSRSPTWSRSRSPRATASMVHGYLTFPSGQPRRALPTVLNVHGGPWARDTWGYDAEAQWLANRGYLCVQVNFRGSTGYGKGFLNAGEPRVGRQDARRPASTPYATSSSRAMPIPSGSAIYGGSYGGYAALVGATFTPDVFRCAVDIVGPSNLETLIRSIPPYWAPMIAQFHARVGNPDTEPDFLWSRSPLSRGRRHQDPAADRPGRQRPPGQAGRERADRRRAPREGHPARVHALPRRGPRLRQAGEQAAFLRGGRAVPRRAPRRAGRAAVGVAPTSPRSSPRRCRRRRRAADRARRPRTSPRGRARARR